MKRNFIFCIFAFLMAVLPAYAERNDTEYDRHIYNFAGIQAGTQLTFTDAAKSKLITPIGGISIGRFFSPAVGVRLNVQGIKSKGAYKANGNDNIYSFKYATTDVDLLLNLTNIIKPSNNWNFSINLIGGIGLAATWDGSEMNSTLRALNKKSAWQSKNQLAHNARVGVQFEYNVAKHWAVNLEVDGNNMGDRFNGKLTNSCDWQMTAMLGVSYKWGFKKKRHSSNLETPSMSEGLDKTNSNPISEAGELVVPDKPKEEQPKVEEKPKPEEPKPVVKEKMHTEVFFTIGSSKPSKAEEAKVAKLAQWLKQHPNAKVVITSYADKGTGNASINLRISKQRSASVHNLLVNTYGVNASRISSDYKGDTVQPFAENDKNRVTLAVAEE